MNSPVQKIKERLSIEEVVSSYIKLEQIGGNLKARCPFHNEKTPSFFISTSRGTYYCFGCGAKGDIFTFVEEFEGLDFRGALKLLASRAGVPLDNYNPKEESEKERLYKAMEEATIFFEKNLSKNPAVLKYLKFRGLEDKTIKDFRIGFAKNDWRELYTHLKTKGFSDKEIELAGLAKKPDDQSKGMYDRFRSRVMFPISDSSGRVIAFSGRIFEDDVPADKQVPTQAKYLNSPETPIFSKSSVLYGLDKAKESIRKNNFAILVEGQMDLILSHQVGFKNTIASSGTALADSTTNKENVVSNLGLVRRLTSNIVLAFDADNAGLNATERAGKIALALGMDVKIADLSSGKDPADLILSSGESGWRSAIRNSKHIIEYILGGILGSSFDEHKTGKEIKEKVLPYIPFVESAIEKMHFLKKISDSSGISLEALKDDLKKVEQSTEIRYSETEKILESKDQAFRKDHIERRLLGIILWQRSLSNPSIDHEAILEKLAQMFNVSKDQLLERVKDSVEDLVFEAEVFYGGDTKLEIDAKEMIENLEEECLKEELFKKMKELNIADRDKDTEKSKQILKDISELNQKIQNIKNSRINK